MATENDIGAPFQSYDQGFHIQDQTSVFGASPIAGAQDIAKRAAASNTDATAVSLPPHLFIPGDAQSIDVSELANVPPATTVNLMTFKGLKGGLVKFIGYAIFNDALMLALINLVPRVNGVRVLPFHGNPNLNFKLGLGLGPDLSVLIPVQLDLQPGDILTWDFTNNDVVDVAAGVRMSGYFSQDIIRKTGRFGG
jgi:hypothetical protein